MLRLLTIAFLFLFKTALAQLHGVYTISYKFPPSSTNYRSINAAVADMVTGTRTDTTVFNNGPGVNSHVVFLIDSGIYNERVKVPPISGATDTSTITFDGGINNATTRIISFEANTGDTAYTFLIAGASYIRVKNVSVQSTGAYANTVQMLSGTKNIVIKNCIIKPYTATTKQANLTQNYGIAFSNTLAVTSNGKFDSICIDSNYFSGPRFGIQILCSASNPSYNIRITNNFFDNVSGTAININNTNGVKIQNNNIVLSMDASTAINLNGCKSVAVYPLTINCNKIYGFTQHGINLNTCNISSAYPAFIINNYVKSGVYNQTMGGINIGTAGCHNTKIYHNTVVIDNNNQDNSSACMKVSNGSQLDIRNNQFIVSNGQSLAVPLYINTPSNISYLDYNNYFKKDVGTGNLIYLGAWYNAANYRYAAGFDSNAYDKDPIIINEYKTRRQCLTGILTSVDMDIEGQTRNSIQPTLGAYEIYAKPNDLGIVKLLSPLPPINFGLNDVKCLVYNFGLNDIKNFNVSYIYNGGSVISRFVTDTAKACDTLTVSFSTAQRINISGGDSLLKTFTSLALDSNKTNDTLYRFFATALNGTYTIGSAPANFPSINSAVTALNTRGVSGRVIFNIKPGTYYEQIVLGNISGVSAINTVTFKSLSNNKDSVTIRYSPTLSSTNYVVNLSGSAYINLKYLTIKNDNASFGTVVLLSSGNYMDTIQNCLITTVNVSSGLSQFSLIRSISSDSFIYILDNLLLNGSKGINFDILVNNYNQLHIYRNTLLNNALGVFIRQSKNVFINANIINNQFSYRSFNGIYLQSVLNSYFSIAYNKIYIVHDLGYVDKVIPQKGSNGITVVEAKMDTFNPAKIYNNVVNITKSGTSIIDNNGPSHAANALTIVWSNNIDIYFNTFNVDLYYSSPSGGYAGTVYFNNPSVTLSCYKLIFKNNVVSNLADTAVTIKWVIAWDAGNFISCNADYDLYYSHGLSYSPAAYSYFLTSYRTYQSTRGYDSNSVISHPCYIDSINNLQPNPVNPYSWYLNGMGTHKIDLQYDIDSNQRPINRVNGAPDIGAYEFTPYVSPPDIFPVASTGNALQHNFVAFADTIAKIIWPNTWSIPSGYALKYYPGMFPNISNNYGRMNSVFSFSDTNTFYSFDLELKYRKPQLGNIANESSLKIANKVVSSSPWSTLTTSTVDSVYRVLKISGYSNLGKFSATDQNNPMPIKLINLAGVKQNKDVLLFWQTAWEQNSSHFILEYSYDAKNFFVLTKIKAAGNSTTLNKYNFIHTNAFNKNVEEIFYRLKMFDLDGAYEHSNTIRISNTDAPEASVFPNPFTDNFTVRLISQKPSTAEIELFDLNGKRVYFYTYQTEEGLNNIKLAPQIQNGMYFLKLTVDSKTTFYKILKY